MGNRAKLPGMDDLEHLREEIGALDRAVLETLNRRLELVKRVNRHKQATGAPLIDATREAELLHALEHMLAGLGVPLSLVSFHQLEDPAQHLRAVLDLYFGLWEPWQP